MSHRILLSLLAALLVVSVLALPTSAVPVAKQVSIDTYIRQLEDKVPRVRYDAVRALAESKSPRALDALLAAMKSKDDNLRQSIVGALTHFDSPRVADALISALQDPSPMVRHSAMQRLHEIKGIDDRLVGMLVGTTPSVQLPAAGVLVDMKDERGVEPLLAALKNSDLKVRRLAVQYVGEIWEPRMVEPLIGLLKDPDPVTRTHAINALGCQRDARAFDPLAAAVLEEKSAEVRSSALNALMMTDAPRSIPVIVRLMKADHEVFPGMLPDLSWESRSPEMIPYLAEGLKESDPMIRLGMLRYLEEIRDPRALEVIRGLLKDKDEGIRLDAQDTVDTEKLMNPPPLEAGPADVPKLLKMLRSEDAWERDPALRALCKIGGQKVIDGLVALLSDPNPALWDAAGSALARIGDPKSIPQITALLAKGGLVTVAAARALQWMGEKESAVKPLIKLLASPDPSVRRLSTAILGDLHDLEAVTPIIDLLKDPKVGNTAIESLGRIGGPQATKALVPLMRKKDGRAIDDGSSYVTITVGNASRALALIGDASILPDVIPLLKDPNPLVRGDAAWLLGELGDPRAVDALLPLLKDTGKMQADPVYTEVAQALGKIGDKRAVPALIDLLRNPDTRAMEVIEALAALKDPRAVDALIGLLPSDFAARALGKIADQRAVEPLIKLLNSPFPENWRSAAEGLGDLRAKAAADRLSAMKHLCPQAIVALGQMKDPRIFDELLALLKADTQVKFGSIVSALGDYGDSRAVEPIIELLKYNSPATNRIAAEALGKLKDPHAVGPLIAVLKNADRAAKLGYMTSLDYNAEAPSDPLVVVIDVDPKEWEHRPQVCSALKAITGQDFGEDTQRWVSWWESQNNGAAK